MSGAPVNRLDRLAAADRQAAIEFVEKLRQQFDGQVLSVLLFGSRERDDADPESDMDLVVVMPAAGPEVRKAVRYLAVEVWLEHGIYLSTRVWSQAHWRELEEKQTLLYRNISRDGISLLV